MNSFRKFMTQATWSRRFGAIKLPQVYICALNSWRRKDRAIYRFHTRSASMSRRHNLEILSPTSFTWATSSNTHSEYSGRYHHICRSKARGFLLFIHYPNKSCIGCRRSPPRHIQSRQLPLLIFHPLPPMCHIAFAWWEMCSRCLYWLAGFQSSNP